MKRLASLLLVAFVLAIASLSAQEPKTPANPPPRASAKNESPPVTIAGLGQRRELTLRERRKLGLTTVNAVAAALELARDGVITADTDQSITSARILSRLAVDHPEIDSEDPEFQDRLMEWLEGIFRFILNALKNQGKQ